MPTVASAVAVSLEVSNNNQDFSTNNVVYQYLRTLRFLSLVAYCLCATTKRDCSECALDREVCVEFSEFR